MRARLLAVGALVALAGAPTAHARGCPHHLPRAPALPAPLEIVTRCGVFGVTTDGSVRWSRRHTDVPAWAPGAVSHPDSRTWVPHPHGRLAIYRDGHLFWRSHVRRVSDDVAVRDDLIAFTVYRGGHTGVWVARRPGRERPVGAGKMLVGWTRGGLVTQRGTRIRLRTPGGELVRTLARAHVAFRDGDSILLLTKAGRIVRTDGVRQRLVGDLVRLRLAKQPWMVRLPNGLIQVQFGNRVVFLRPEGSRFAHLPRGADPLRDESGSGGRARSGGKAQSDRSETARGAAVTAAADARRLPDRVLDLAY